MAFATSSVVGPVSKNTASPSLSSSTARAAMARLPLGFWTRVRACEPSLVSEAGSAPPWNRSTCPSSASDARSRRIVGPETPNSSVSSSTVTRLDWLTFRTISFRRSSGNICAVSRV
jgi:hypothetical protein